MIIKYPSATASDCDMVRLNESVFIYLILNLILDYDAIPI